MSESAAYEGWALLELMGHRRRVGYIREVDIAGGKLLRIDVPVPGAEELLTGAITEFYGTAAIYALRPISEEVARTHVKNSPDPRPVRPVDYQLEDQRSRRRAEFDDDYSGADHE